MATSDNRITLLSPAWLSPAWNSTLLGLALLCLSGCQMTAPIHVWRPPSVAPGGPIRVALAPIAGEPQVAEQLEQAMALSRPQTMPQLAVISPDELQVVGGIQLVAYDGQPSEMAALGAARRAGANYLMTGEVVSFHWNEPEPENPYPTSFSWFQSPPPPETLTVRWHVFEVPSGRRLGEQTISMQRDEVDKQFPDLAYQSDAAAKVVAASARRSWELVVPTTYAKEVFIDLPWFAPGSSSVRKGNAYARVGQWEMAEREWQDAADAHNWNTAAWKNLAIAAVAREDFALARARLKYADWQYWPGDGARKTRQWIEEQQREYHAAFDIPPPEEGWSFQESPSIPPQVPNETPAALGPNQPVSLDNQPWYTALPWMPPPGWTWSQWWSQPWVW